MKNSLLKDILKILSGGILLGLAYAKLMVPNQIISGGVTSLSMILSEVSPFNVSFYTQVLTISFLVLSFIFLGGKNFWLSLLSSLAYTQSFAFFMTLSFSIHTLIVIDFLLASFLIGFGYYLCLSSGASTVGIEVIALILKKFYERLHLANTIRIINMIVLAFGFLVYGLKAIIIGILFSYLYSEVLDYMLKRDPIKSR